MTREEANSLKVGDKVKHGDRRNYQNCEILEIEEGCNGGIKLLCQDGFYGKPDITTFPIQDLSIVNME